MNEDFKKALSELQNNPELLKLLGNAGVSDRQIESAAAQIQNGGVYPELEQMAQELLNSENGGQIKKLFGFNV